MTNRTGHNEDGHDGERWCSRRLRAVGGASRPGARGCDGPALAVRVLAMIAAVAVPLPTGAQEVPPPPVEPDTLISFDLTEDESAILREYLPNAYEKFRMRRPVHAVMIGDSVSNLTITGSTDNMNWVRGFPYKFLDRISEQFYYTGGVRVVQPRRGYPSKALPLVGNELTLRTMSRGGRTALYANQIILANAFEHAPDVVFLSFGINDAMGQLSLSAYEAALREAIARTRAAGAEPVLMGSTLLLTGWDALSQVRTYNLAMRNLARQENVWFVDLGNPGWFISAPPADSSPAERVEQAMLGLRSWYGVNDLIHPNLKAHERIGLRLFKELLGERASSPLEVRDAWVSDVGESGFRAHARVAANGMVQGGLVVAPLVSSGLFKPDTSIIELSADDAEEDGTWLVTLDYTAVSGDPEQSRRLIDLLDERRRPAIPLHWLVMDDERVGLNDVAARIEPLGVRWNFIPVWNAPGRVDLRIELVAGSEPVGGSFKALWLEQETGGRFELEGDGREMLTLEFPIPESGQRTGRAEGPLRIEFETNRGAVVLERHVSALRNLALGQPFPLETGTGADPAGNVDFTVQASAGELRLTFDLAVGELVSTAANAGAVVIELLMDARGFEQRARRGGTDVMRIAFPATTGPGTVTNMLPWSFGTGYGMDLPVEGFSANIESISNGTHRVEIVIPSSYLYLHEWALGDVNSQIGINPRVSVLKVDDGNPGGWYPNAARWSLLNPLGQREDTSNLGRVELSETASGRWSVRIY